MDTHTDQTLAAFLADRPLYQLQRLQRTRNCRVLGKKSRRRDLIQSLLASAQRDGWTVAQARSLLLVDETPKEG